MSKDKLIGHENIVEGLKQSIVNNRISHSYLFQGEESIGKKKLALLFAKTLLCKSGGLEACNKCISCKKFDSQNHPDFWLVEAEKNIIRKEKVDQVIKSVNTYPLESNRKIIIIDSSHKMGIESQNALLKTLEEPPSYMNIILITEEKEQILPTILSRCQIIKFNPVALKLVEEFIVENYPEEADKASFINR